MSTSIIILTFNKIEYTKRCIESIRKYTDDEEYELIIVDNNSTDETIEWLGLQKDLKVIFNDKNVGFPSGCNIGIKASNNENDILLLNNDTIVTYNWLQNLRKSLYSNELIGAVGPTTNSSAYYQQIDVNYKNIYEMQEFALKHNISNEELWEERQKLIGFCMLIKRKALDEVGLLDEVFTPGNFEDDDYSIRLIQKGYKLILCFDTFIHHYGGVSFSNNSEYNHIIKKNEIAFQKKWGFTSRENMNIYRENLQFIEGTYPRVLEFYCGTGATALYLTQKCNCKYYGYEDNNKALSYLNSSEINTFSKFEEIDQKDKGFDYYLISDLTKFLNDKEIKNQAIKRIKTHTKLIINFKEDENNEINIQKIISLFGSEKYQVTGGVNKINTISSKLNRSYLVLTDKVYNQVINYIVELNEGDNQCIYYLVEIVISNNSFLESIIRAVLLYSNDIINVLNTIGVLLFEQNIINCSEAFKAAYDYDNNDYTTLMNYSEFFYKTGQYDLALQYIGMIEEKDELCKKLLTEIINKRDFERNISFILRRIEFEIDADNSLKQIIDLINIRKIDENLLIKCIDNAIVNKISLINYLSVNFFKNQVYDVIIPLLLSAYQYDSQDFDTNYNLGYILNAFGEQELALNYLKRLKNKNDDIMKLINIIKGEADE